ncbi:Uncharacterized protein PAT169_1799 [Pseudomonas aeruginosa]|nr:hypothetical protein CSB94_3806 [Pseudomonas aeruginosa]QEO35805.1 Uncharacterized protein PAT169_1799 [Pseudomonas aeruginosa]
MRTWIYKKPLAIEDGQYKKQPKAKRNSFQRPPTLKRRKLPPSRKALAE